MKNREIFVLSISHMFNDVSQGAIPALLPFIVLDKHLTYTEASGIVFSATIISSIIQPVLGLYSDKHPIPWLMPIGVLAGGFGIALSGIAPSYLFIILSVFISGMGVAAFHPEGSRFANYVSQKKASGMSYFTVGGTLGFSLGPIMITPLVLWFGLRGTLFMIIPSVIVAIWLYRELPHLETFRPKESVRRTQSVPGNDWPSFIRLGFVIFLRTAVYFGLLSFVPLYYIKVRGAGVAEANTALTFMLICGAAGAVIGGHLADRIGLRKVLLGSLSMIAPMIYAVLWAPGFASYVLLCLLGMTTVAGSTVSVVMGQGYLKSNIGVASGITLGLAIGLGGLGVPIFGYLADHFSLTASFYGMMVFPVLALVIAATLPPIFE